MSRQPASTPHVSQHHLEGSLADVSLERILDSCHRHLLTGMVRIQAGGKVGVIELRAGAVDQSSLGNISGREALTQMRSLRDGMYEIIQRLPDLTGELGGSSAAEGDVSGVPLIAIMRHCEDNALTCTITVVSAFDRAQIDYRAGDLKRVELNGVADDDAIVKVLAWKDARYRVAAPPLDLDVEGWPQVKGDPTKPFSLKDGPMPPKKETAAKDEAKKAAGKTPIEPDKAKAKAEDKAKTKAEAKAKAEDKRAAAPADAPTRFPLWLAVMLMLAAAAGLWWWQR